MAKKLKAGNDKGRIKPFAVVWARVSAIDHGPSFPAGVHGPFGLSGHSTFHLPHSRGASSASLGTSAVMAVALLLQ